MRFLIVLTAIFIYFSVSHAQCTFNGSQFSGGTLTPTPAYQTVTNVNNGEYFTVNVTCGTVYNFNFCNNGGTAGWDTQITVLQTNGTTSLAYNDDACGLQSNVSYTATFTGTVYVLVTQYFCNYGGGSSGTMAYNGVPGSFNASFTISATSCSSANSTITGNTGGTFSFNPLPGDGAIINPTTGQITNGTGGSSYTVQYTVACGTSTTQNVTLPAGGNASFTLAASCGGAISTITGNTGGTFSFNPLPGDGAQINASSGQINNATAGNSYTVQYTVCGASSTQNVTVLTDNCFNLNGNAQYITVGGEQCIQLTAEVNNQTGCSWNTNTVDFSQGFSLTLEYYFGNNINGADGNTFTFQPSSSSACGQNGGQLGAGGLSNALSIEFDTYDNDNPAHIYDMSCDHIAVEIDGNHLGPGAPYAGPVCAKAGGGNIDDGGTYEVVIEWDPVSQTLNIYFDGSLRLSTTGNFVASVFGGQSQVYWGATSATGGLNNQQYFCPSTVTVLPVELTHFESVCTKENTLLRWSSASENRLQYYQAEYSIDGTVYYAIETVVANGNTSSISEYEIQLPNLPDARLFRLKMVDEDGALDYSPVISREQCLSHGLIANQYTMNGNTHLQFNEPCQVEVLDMLGKRLASSEVFVSEFNFVSAVPMGLYIIQARGLSSNVESRKVLLGRE
jgi:hypothetical protein